MQSGRRVRATLESLALRAGGVALATLLWVPSVRAADGSAPAVSLDQLLRIPDQVHVEAPRRGGATRGEWRARFETAREERDRAQTALHAAQEELEEKATAAGNWQMTAPGAAAGSNDGPLSYRLSLEIRHQREEVQRTEKRLRELRVEANLAGVPTEWIDSEPPPGPAQP